MTVATGQATDSLGLSDTDAPTISASGAAGIRTIRRFAFDSRVNFGSLAAGFENVQGPSLTLTDTTLNSPVAPVTLANTFTMMRNASILGFRYYKHPGMTGTVPYRMWDSGGTVLASGNLPGTLVSDGGGWMTVMFAAPVAVAANSEYSIGVYSADNNYAWAPWVWSSQDAVFYPFRFKLMSETGGTRVDGSGAAQGTGIAFPTARKSADYYIDPLGEWTDDMPGYDGGTSWYDQFETAGSRFSFPVAVWWPEASDYAAYKAIGVNTIMAGPPTQDKADAVKVSDLDWYPSLHTDAGGGDVSAVVMTQEDVLLQPHIRGYHLTDEPDLGTPWNSPTVVRSWANAARLRDSSRPLIMGLSYLPVKNQSFFAQPPGAGALSWNQSWRDYLAISDIAKCDFYSLAGGSDSYNPSAPEILGDSYGKYGLWTYPRQISRMRELTDNSKPVWGIVEATSEMPGAPTPELVRRAVWSQLIAGARGILFFNHRFGTANVTQDFATIIHDSAMSSMVSALSTQLQTLGPALHAAEAGLVEDYTSSGAMAVTQGGYAPGAPIPVHYTSRMAGGTSYIFAQVIRSGATTATFFVPSLAGATLTVIGESRSVNVNGTGYFSDTFAADYSVHLYSTATAPSFSAPVNTVAPAVSTDGTPETGETVSCSTGTWTGVPTPTYTFQWQRNGSNIATGATYVLQVADEGQSIRCRVTATNAQGSATANSNTITPSASSGGSTAYQDEILLRTPIGYWKLSDLTDSSGNGLTLTQSGSPTGSASLIPSDPGAGKAKKFNQGLDVLSVANTSVLNPTEFSLMCSFKYSAGNLVIVTKGSTRLSTGSSNDLKFNFDLAVGGASMFGASASGALTIGQTYIAVLTFDGTTTKLYLDNTEVFSSAFSGALKSNTSPFRIGAGIPGSDLPWNDVVDEVAYYDSALSAVDVDALYVAATTGVGGGGDTAPSNTVAPVITTDGTPQTGESVSCSVGTWTGTPTPTFARQWQRNGTNISGATGSSYTLDVADEGQSIRCVVTATNSAGSASANSGTITPLAPASSSYSDAVLADTPIGYWKLSDLNDSSGNGLTLTQSGTPTAAASLVPSDSGASKAKDFNQGSDELSVASTTILNPSEFSLELSFKFSASDLAIVTKGTTRIETGPSSNLRFHFDLAVSGEIFSSTAASSLTSGQTYHTVLTFDGDTTKLYLNGTEVVSIDFSGALKSNTDPFRIGAGIPGTDFPWNDVIDDVSYYDHGLSPTRVAAHYAAWLTGGSSSGQAAVDLTPLDGELITTGVQSNWDDNGYFTRNGFTYAADNRFDDVTFVPISMWAQAATSTGEFDTLDDVGINGMFPANGSHDLVTGVSRNIWATVPNDDWPGGTVSSSEDPAVIGVIAGEEPSTIAEYDAITTNGNTWLASSDGAGRFQECNFADNLMNGEVESTYFPDEMVLQGDYTLCDQYWFAGAPSTSGLDISRSKLMGRLYYPNAGVATPAQCARGSHYGSMLDSFRKQFTGQVNPIGCWIEAAAPYTETTSAAITAAQLKWAVWSTLVHGARGIFYFVHNFRTGDTWGSPPFDSHFGAPGVTGTGIYAAMKEVNTRAQALAEVINAPFDGYFVYGDTDTSGSIANAGFLTAVTSTNSRSKFGGVDACCKWHPVDQKHYILATTREQDGTTGWPVTFRMVDQGQTTAVEVHESNSITIDRGGSIPDGFCEFSDTFATAATYKTYRID